MPLKKTPLTDAAIKELIAQGVADALANYEANRSSGNGDDSHDLGIIMEYLVKMDNANITMEYIRLEEEKSRRHGKVYNWETAMYGKIRYDENVHDLGSAETEFPTIVFNDKLTSEATLSCERTISSLNNDEINFRISFDESDDEDCTVNKVQVMGTLDGRLLNNASGTSYSAVTHFGGVTDWYLEPRLAMSPDNASSAVTYTSISSYSNRPSWGIPLVNAGELPEMDPYEEVAQQGQAPPLSHAYVPDLMELDEHVPPYADDALPIAESESMKDDYIDYPDEPENDDEDPEEDLEEDHTDYPADGEDGDDELSDDDNDDDDTDDEDEDPTED
ncbi:hypothetical protein Tco_0934320 [Tanacetum coccineum]